LKVGTGFIHINDLNTSGEGFRGDVNDNDQTIDVATAVANGLISFGADHKTVIINPTWDLDLASNYSISIDAGAFVNEVGGAASKALAAVSFGTVTPGQHNAAVTASVAEAHSSQTMTDSGGLQADNRWWIDLEGINAGAESMLQLGDLADKAYVLVAKNYQTTPADGTIGSGEPGITMAQANVGVTNFGLNDQLYFDSQANDATKQSFLPAMLSAILNAGNSEGGVAGQNQIGWSSTSDGQAYVGLGLQGDTSNDIFEYIYEADARTYEGNDLSYKGMTSLTGWENAHPVIMA
jgi:hypothetical protein